MLGSSCWEWVAGLVPTYYVPYIYGVRSESPQLKESNERRIVREGLDQCIKTDAVKKKKKKSSIEKEGQEQSKKKKAKKKKKKKET